MQRAPRARARAPAAGGWAPLMTDHSGTRQKKTSGHRCRPPPPHTGASRSARRRCDPHHSDCASRSACAPRRPRIGRPPVPPRPPAPPLSLRVPPHHAGSFTHAKGGLHLDHVCRCDPNPILYGFLALSMSIGAPQTHISRIALGYSLSRIESLNNPFVGRKPLTWHATYDT